MKPGGGALRQFPQFSAATIDAFVSTSGDPTIPELAMASTPPEYDLKCVTITIYKYKLIAFMHSKIFKFALALAFVAGAAVTAGVVTSQAILQEQFPLQLPLVQELPAKAVFPGPWDKYIQAPSNKTHIRPKAVKLTEGSVANVSAVLEGALGTQHVTLGPGGIVIFDFKQNIGGR